MSKEISERRKLYNQQFNESIRSDMNFVNALREFLGKEPIENKSINRVNKKNKTKEQHVAI